MFSSAMPRELPTCWVALTRALATPASPGGTRYRAVPPQQHEGQPHAETEEDLGWQDVGDVGTAHGQPAQPQHAHDRAAEPHYQERSQANSGQ